MSLEGDGRRWTVAQVGAQASHEAPHTDRCVAQYGLLMDRTINAGMGKRVGRGRLIGIVRRGRVFELGVSVRGRARVSTGLSTSVGTVTDT